MNSNMKIIFTVFIVLIFLVNISGQKYKFTADSLPQEGVPKGIVKNTPWKKAAFIPAVHIIIGSMSRLNTLIPNRRA